jgi:hypothetical protein
MEQDLLLQEWKNMFLKEKLFHEVILVIRVFILKLIQDIFLFKITLES